MNRWLVLAVAVPTLAASQPTDPGEPRAEGPGWSGDATTSAYSASLAMESRASSAQVRRRGARDPRADRARLLLASRDAVAQKDEGDQPRDGEDDQQKVVRAIKRCKAACAQKQRACLVGVNAKTKRCISDTLEQCKQLGCPCSVWLQPYQQEQCQRACNKCAVKKKQEAEANCDYSQEGRACAKEEATCQKACE